MRRVEPPDRRVSSGSSLLMPTLISTMRSPPSTKPCLASSGNTTERMFRTLGWSGSSSTSGHPGARPSPNLRVCRRRRGERHGDPRQTAASRLTRSPRWRGWTGKADPWPQKIHRAGYATRRFRSSSTAGSWGFRNYGLAGPRINSCSTAGPLSGTTKSRVDDRSLLYSLVRIGQFCDNYCPNR